MPTTQQSVGDLVLHFANFKPLSFAICFHPNFKQKCIGIECSVTYRIIWNNFVVHTQKQIVIILANFVVHKRKEMYIGTLSFCWHSYWLFEFLFISPMKYIFKERYFKEFQKYI
jgi:hypothetical protein